MPMKDTCYQWTLSGSKPISEFEKIRNDYRAAGQKIVTANGCFDILHNGHLSTLAKAKALGDILIVGVSSDRVVKKVKGAGRPVFPERDRASLLLSLACVDHVVVFDDILPNEFLERIRPDFHCISGEYAQKNLPEKEIVEKNGGIIEVLPFIPGYSTTDIIQKINHHKTDSGTHAPPIPVKDTVTDYLFESSTSVRCLAYQHGETLGRIAGQIADAIESNAKIFLLGDSRSSLDVQQIAAELNRRFSADSKPFPAIALSADRADIVKEDAYARQLESEGKPGDLLIILSANADAKEMLAALEAAGEIGMPTIAFIGNAASPLHGLCGEVLPIDSHKIPIIQQAFTAAFNGIFTFLDRQSKRDQ